ncbi:MAG: hypothetical protein A2096_05600 [Spirochaetes bacterium GWF1_41_5]|nr:MAG: hypothetical protein A2096_05600 [Spirochaetes bacterium GWF1_41_5]
MKNQHLLFLTAVLFLIIGCLNNPFSPQCEIGIKAKIVSNNNAQTPGLQTFSAPAFTTSQVADNIQIKSYKVIFKRIEIGNSDRDTATLWKNSRGKEKDLVSEVTFTDVENIPAGEYQYLKLTIDKTITVSCDITINGVVQNRTRDITVRNECVWSSAAENNRKLTSNIVIAEGKNLIFTFNVQDSIRVEDHEIKISAPEINVVSQ